MKIRTLICPPLLLFFLLFPQCKGREPHKQNDEVGQSAASLTITPLFAKGFTMVEQGEFTEITVSDPWDTTRILQRYILVPKSEKLPKTLPSGTLVRTPVSAFACFSAIHVAMLQLLDCENLICAVAEPEYISAPFVADGIAGQTIAGLGPVASMNIEKLLEVNPGAILATPFRNAGYGIAEKAGIPIIECADYMEVSPLAQAEWIRCVARFVHRGERADSLFRALADRYHALCQLVQQAEKRPTLFSEKKIGQVWYVAGNESVAGIGFAHAGAEYLFRDVKGTGSVPFSFESVYARAAEADIWLIKYNRASGNLTYRDLQEEYAPYAYFKAFKERRILACNTAQKPYYEMGLLEPDVVLADMIHALHPSLLPHHKPVYFDFLQE